MNGSDQLGDHKELLSEREGHMEKWLADNSFSIGNTPLVKINKMAQGLKATVLGKTEGRNPACSVKCRIGANMVWTAEKQGLLKPGMEIIEPTSGNTGIALAYVAAARGYKLNITMPETMSVERRKVLSIFGANIILTPGAKGMKGAIEEAGRIAASHPDYFMPQQFKNPANPEIHFKTTGPEIWEQTGGGIDVLVSGVGTGGTISGVSRYIKGEKKKKILSVAVEPVESPVITQHLAGKEIKPGPHKIQGIGAGFIPDTLDLSIVDRVELVTSEEAIEHARRLAREEGILAGVSCGAAIAVALRLAKSGDFDGKTIVAILPDSGERYLSGPLFDGLFDESGLPRI
jgi:cysteine synthase